MPTARASTQQEQLRAPASPVHEPEERAGLCVGHQPPAVPEVGLLGGEVLDGPVRGVEAAGVDALADVVGVEVGEPVEGDVGGLVGPRQRQAGEVGVEAAEDHDRAVLLADVVLVLAPGPGDGGGDPDQPDQDRRAPAGA